MTGLTYNLIKRGAIALTIGLTMVLTAGIANAEESQATFKIGHLRLHEGTDLTTFFNAVEKHETENKLIPSQKEDLVAIFKQYDFDGNGKLNAAEMLVGCMQPRTPEQLEAYKKGRKKKGGGGGKVPGPIETGCTGTCNCDYISSGVGGIPQTDTSEGVIGTGDPIGGYPGTNQNCFAKGDPNCHCPCNTGVCAAGGT